MRSRFLRSALTPARPQRGQIDSSPLHPSAPDTDHQPPTATDTATTPTASHTDIHTAIDVAPTLSELIERYGVPEAELAAALGWEPAVLAARRAEVAPLRWSETQPAAAGVWTAPAPLAPAAPATPAAPAAPAMEQPGRVDAVIRWLAGVYLLGLLSAVVYYKSAFIQMLTVSPLLSTYGLIVVLYISSRFFFSAFYRPSKDHGIEPHVAIVMPGFNEEDAIARSLRSLLELEYPAAKLEIVAVNDGSTDATLAEMEKVAATAGGRVRVIDFPENRGKRAAMAAGIRATQADIVAFVDSDSVLDPHAMRILVQGFHDPKVGAICGHADVLNVRDNWITKMQAVRYFVAFSVNKAAESVFSMVTCCSGCFSAYRREAIMPHLDWWENQKFLGRDSTFGDDRSLTNCVLRGWKVRYESRAVSHTIVPDNFRQFMRQQLRWKRSWTRESLILARFAWRKNPIPAVCAYVGMALPIVAPVIAAHAILLMPAAGAGAPVLYLVGIYAMSVCYGLYYAARRPRYDYLWVYGIAFCFFYLAFLLWQTYYAIATTRSAAWGTRPASAGLTPSTAAELT